MVSNRSTAKADASRAETDQMEKHPGGNVINELSNKFGFLLFFKGYFCASALIFR
jgi:hypothetical protein